MPHDVKLPNAEAQAGWKVKIREKERLEPPHVTILHRGRSRRVGLRDGAFLVPPGGSWNEIPVAVREAIEDAWEDLRRAWDAKYPSNPIGGDDDDR